MRGVKEQIEQCSVPPKSKTGEGLQFIINQEKYLRVFLEDGDVPIDNSASERAIRTFCLEKRIGCFIILRMVLLQVRWCIAFPKQLS